MNGEILHEIASKLGFLDPREFHKFRGMTQYFPIKVKIDRELFSIYNKYSGERLDLIFSMLLRNYFCKYQIFSMIFQVEYDLIELRKKASDELSVLPDDDERKPRLLDMIVRIDDQLEWLKTHNMDQRTIRYSDDIGLAFQMLNMVAHHYRFEYMAMSPWIQRDIEVIKEHYPDFNIHSYLTRLANEYYANHPEDLKTYAAIKTGLIEREKRKK